MRVLTSLLPVGLLLLPAACASGPDIQELDDGLVSLRVESSVDGIQVQDLKMRSRAGRATAQFFLFNESEKTLRVFVRLEWSDEDGFLLEDSIDTDPRSRLFELPPGSRRAFTFYSPEAEKAPAGLRCTIEPGRGRE